MAPELAGKRLELLKETIPELSRVAVLWHPGNPGSERIWKESQLAAPRLGLQLHSMEVTSADQFEGAFQEATKAGSTALAVTLSSLINKYRDRIAELAIKNRLPAIFSRLRPVRSGGLMSYAADRSDQFRRAATYVDKILKGARPADLPVQRLPKFRLAVNLKTAKALGITFPSSVLLRATDVIE
jgi:putative ABC transport system substrate-binding protein